MSIILASKSPRRKELLSVLGVDFKIMTADIDESINEALPIEEEIARLSLEKGLAVRENASEEDVIISADTVVVLGNTVMGKPKDSKDAVAMLKSLSAKTHRVITGVTVMKDDTIITETVTTSISFRELSDSEISAYVATCDCMDKAGSYGIQGKAAVFVSKIEGDYFNVVGLPIATLYLILKKIGINLP